MTLPAFASLDDLEARTPGGIAVADMARAQAALDDVAAVMRRVAGKSWATDDALAFSDEDTDRGVPELLVKVNCGAARRVLSNPDGAESESIDGYSRAIANASPDAYLTTAERQDIRWAAAVAGFSELGIISTTRGAMETANVLDCYDGGLTGLVEADAPYTLWP